MILIDMRLNFKKSTHVVVNNNSIAAQYWFTKDDVSGMPPGHRKVWAIINFQHPEKRELVRLRVAESQSILDATHGEVEQFIEAEVDCYINHCDEYEMFADQVRIA